MTVRYSPAAREDLRALRRYLAGEFGSAVADKALRKIVSDISLLKAHPNLLRPLSDKVKRATDYRYLLCGRYSVVIATLEANLISVVRILDGRTDYAAAVFGIADESDSHFPPDKSLGIQTLPNGIAVDVALR